MPTCHQRINFKKTIVLDSYGRMVDPEVWEAKVKGHRVATTLKKEGFHKETIFLKDQYEQVKVAYYAVKHEVEKKVNEKLIDVAFEHVGVPKTKRVERILYSIMPLIKNKDPEEKVAKLESVISAFKPIVYNHNHH